MTKTRQTLTLSACIPYNKILKLLASDRYNGFTHNQIISKTGVVNAQDILDQMESNSIVGVIPRHDGKFDYIITPTGLGILVRENGYYDFVMDELKSLEQGEEKRALEMKKLKHDVSVSKWQFRLLVVGSTAGLLNLLWTLAKLLFNAKEIG